MANVHVLPPEIVSKIAAGEVIERPASVLKELIENSLDAQSDSINIHLRGAGRTLIDIKDTGTGIDAEDIEKIFLRHATSKINRIDDLFDIDSLGFRGEALYSIAAISDVTLRSKTKHADTGWEIHLRGGEKLKLKPVNMPMGTEIEIKELFYNTPARRKFLKSDSAELHQILNVFIPYAISHPRCRFLLTHSSKTLLNLPPAEDTLERISQSLNLKKEHMIDVRREFSDARLSLRMTLGNINIQRTRKDMQFLFVNNRPVQSRNLSFHMNQIYKLILPEDIFPFFAVFVNIHPSNVDVNIHPTKREVKIKDENTLVSLLRSVCEQALMSQGQAKQAKDFRRSIPEVKPKQITPLDKQVNQTGIHVQGQPTRQPHHEEDLLPFETPVGTILEQKERPQEKQLVPQEENLFPQEQDNLKGKLSSARFIGAFIKKYLLFETGNSLLVVDQHAAQERITFEQFKKQIQTGHIEVQHLLSPILISLSVQEMISWEEGKETLELMGLSTTQWDNASIAIHSYPNLIKNPEVAVRNLLGGEKIAYCDDDTLARRACRQSVMTGDKMSEQEARYQREQLMNCADPFTCPHGRPTVVEIKENFLDRQFLRPT